MLVWRLTRPEFAPGLDGLGARRVGGRWNSPGRPAVYCAGSLALAALEVFVHLPPSMRTPEKLPELNAVCLRLPDGATVTEVGWDKIDDPGDIECFRRLGDAWLDTGSALALRAPSLVIPAEFNLILNPLHAGMASVEIVSNSAFRFDPRLGTT
jgi:Uncharacterized conserved protein